MSSTLNSISSAFTYPSGAVPVTLATTSPFVHSSFTRFTVGAAIPVVVPLFDILADSFPTLSIAFAYTVISVPLLIPLNVPLSCHVLLFKLY